MTVKLRVRGGAVFCFSVLVLLSGCQTFNGIKAKFTEKSKNPRPSVLTESEFTADVKPEQKANVQMAIGRALESQGETQQAIDVYLDVVKQDGRRAEAYHRLAVLHDMKGDVQAARMYYEIALKKAPKNAELCCDVGYSYYLQRKWSEAEKHLRRAIALNPRCERAHTNLGLVLARTNRAQEALLEFARAGCDEATGRCNLAFAMKLEQRWPEAKRQYELALAANPESQAAKEGLAAIPVGVASEKPIETARNQPAPRARRAPQRAETPERKVETPMVQASYETANAPENLRGGYLGR